MRVSALKGPGGATIDRPHLALFKEWYINVRKATSGYEKSSLGPGWYPDALMPERRSKLLPGFPFSIPDLYNNIPGQKNQGMWIDIFVPFDRTAAPPGRYTGDVRVSWKGGANSISGSLSTFGISRCRRRTHLPGDIWNGSMRNMPPNEELAYYQLARQHRFLPLIYAYRPKLKVNGSRVTLDWTEFDRRLAPYLDGSAFTKRMVTGVRAMACRSIT